MFVVKAGMNKEEGVSRHMFRPGMGGKDFLIVVKQLEDRNSF